MSCLDIANPNVEESGKAAGLHLTLGPGWIAGTWESLFGSCSSVTLTFSNSRKRKHEIDVKHKMTQAYKRARIEANTILEQQQTQTVVMAPM